MPATLTIFTPTYNRAYKIRDLYTSLVAQTSHDFVWLVVDDGSTDETQDVLHALSVENAINMQIAYQENGGKQRAFNYGVTLSNTELFFCVDSDDILVHDAVQSIIDLWSHECSDTTLAGIIALDGNQDGKPLGGLFPTDLARTTTWHLQHDIGYTADTSIIHRTEILKQYPFDVAPGEKFIAETYIYLQIDEHYEVLVMNHVIKLVKYLDDGYSHNARQISRDNPIGYMKIKKMYLDRASTFRDKFESASLYLVGAYFAGQYQAVCQTIHNPFLRTVSRLAAWILRHTAFRKRHMDMSTV